MSPSWTWIILFVAIGYIGLLFSIAHFGDERAKRMGRPSSRPNIYSLSIAVYCTSWTFFGSVGLAATSGFAFLPVYIGPILVFALGTPLILRIVRIAKSQNITSIADFIAARYGKSPMVAFVVTLIAVAGSIPYIALQLKAVTASVSTVLGMPLAPELTAAAETGLDGLDFGFAVAMAMAVFTVLFGTRHIDATEHQDGLMLAIATETVVKLVAFLIVGAFVTFVLFGGVGDLVARAREIPGVLGLYTQGFEGGRWLTVTLLAAIAILLLPRQFHVAVVENHSEREIRRAAWMFPAYLVAINIFVVPIAIAGLVLLPPGAVEKDMFVLGVPMAAGADAMTLLAFVGGLSAATAMVIVESTALSIMICNDVVMPLILRRRSFERDDAREMGTLLLVIRRAAIFSLLLLAYAFHMTIAQPHALASIGLLSFAAIAQVAPAFFGGLVWRSGTARGAIAGLLGGFAMWAYTLLLPWFSQAGLVPQSFLTEGPFGIALLRPQMLFNLQFDPLTHGVVWSLLVNTGLYIGVSLLRPPLSIERLQASIFVRDELPSPATPSFRLWRTSVSIEDLQRTAARYVGSDRADRSFAEHAASRKITLNPHAEADVETIRFTEHLLASAIGAASSRLVLSLLLRRRSVGDRSALRLLDDASEALHYNRDLLQSALDQVGQGITVYDRDLRLICWNREFRTLLDLPTELVRIGVPMYQVLRHLAERGDLGPGQPDGLASECMRRLAIDMQTLTVTIAPTDRVLEFRTNGMPQGGVVTSYTDITERVRAADELARANESLERRVGERTQELVVVNQALAEAKAKADTANLDKTRFLAGASHDLLQPLNAARLYTASLVETLPSGSASRIARNIDTSLDAVEEILSTLLEISRLDAGALKPEITAFPLNELFERLRVEFEPLARDKSLRLSVVATSLVVRSDRKLLQRALQNLVSNAIKYTDSGAVVLGCRRASSAVRIEVHDTGVGIPADKRELIFKEFQRLDPHKSRATGLGLGLSIVERVCRVLNVPIGVESAERRGSRFRLTVPTAEAADVVPVVLQPAVVGGLDGITVICIDNEPAIRDSMRTLLGGWGCSVLAAAGGREAGALLAAAATPPDVVLADYHLDNETGFEVIEAIRARLQAEVPAIVITADRSGDVQAECRKRGYLLLRKPLKPAALRAMMARLRFQAAAE